MSHVVLFLVFISWTGTSDKTSLQQWVIRLFGVFLFLKFLQACCWRSFFECHLVCCPRSRRVVYVSTVWLAVLRPLVRKSVALWCPVIRPMCKSPSSLLSVAWYVLFRQRISGFCIASEAPTSFSSCSWDSCLRAAASRLHYVCCEFFILVFILILLRAQSFCSCPCAWKRVRIVHIRYQCSKVRVVIYRSAAGLLIWFSEGRPKFERLCRYVRVLTLW